MFSSTTFALNFKAINKLNLRFKDKSMESAYLKTTAPVRKLQMRLALLFVGLLYFCVTLLDFYIFPESTKYIAIAIHLSQSFLFCLLAILSLRFKSSFFHAAMIIGSVLLAWVNHLLLINLTDSFSLFGEAYLMIIWVWLISGISITQASKVSIVFVVIYELNNNFFASITPTEELSQHFFIYVSFIFGVLAGYLIEYHKRQNYLELQNVAAQTKQLEKSKRTLIKLSQAVEQSDEAILITDKDGVAEYINPAFILMTGYQVDDIIGKPSDILHDGQDIEIFDTLKQGHVWSGTVNAIKKNGQTYPALLSIAPIKDEQGDIAYYVSTKRDMTQFEHLENQLRQAQKMEAIGTLVGGIAHDFNNTLTGITGTVFLAKNDVANMPKTLEKLDLVEKLAFQASDMVKQLLAFSRKDIVSLQPMSITSFLEDVSKLNKITLPSHITFTQNILDSQDLIIRGDSNQLQQVILNLLNNARDAVNNELQPTISLSLDTWQANQAFKELHPDIAGDSFVRITISDNGCGIKKGSENYIFEPFFTTKDIDEGTGLGLSMAFGAAQSHGGTITVKSEWNNGATFTLYLPLMKDKRIKQPEPSHPSILCGGNQLILLVDDDESVLETGTEILEILGYSVLNATDGLQAIDVYKKHQNDIQLVILDIAMPNMNGFKAAKKLRKINPDVSIVFVTGFDSSQKLNVKGDTSEDVILKPYKIEDFSQKIQSIFKKKRQYNGQ